jgi:hypothetical protein
MSNVTHPSANNQRGGRHYSVFNTIQSGEAVEDTADQTFMAFRALVRLLEGSFSPLAQTWLIQPDTLTSGATDFRFKKFGSRVRQREATVPSARIRPYAMDSVTANGVAASRSNASKM